MVQSDNDIEGNQTAEFPYSSADATTQHQQHTDQTAIKLAKHKCRDL
jgi:hypothetical protein